MINKTEFAVIDAEVKKAISDTLENIKTKSPGNYVLFLADGEYKAEYNTPQNQFSPFVIDNRMDFYKDENRLQFLSQFLNSYYTFVPPQTNTDDAQYRLHIELMAYTHIWESKPFLKKLHRFAHLDNLEEYNWDVVVPEIGNPGKHEFIRDDIRTTFQNNGNPMYEVIKKGYHSSLRNAFAHSEYAFDTINGNTRIWLDNYKGKNWELQEISFDEWSKRFVYSALLSFYLFTLSHHSRTSLIQDLGTDTYRIKHPTKSGATNDVDIVYRQDSNGFNFKR
jgi:hypothetical protein